MRPAPPPPRTRGRIPLGLPVLAALALLPAAAFLPLLCAPHRFPAGGPAATAEGGIADAVVRARAESLTGEVSYLDPDEGGRSRAGDRHAFYTHPLYYALSRFLPAGLSSSLVALLHALALAAGAGAAALRMGLAPGPALFAGAVALFSGGALCALAAPGEAPAAWAAALVPLAGLLAARLRERPSAPRAAALALVTALLLLGGDPWASLLGTAALLVLAVLLERGRREDVEDRTREARSVRAGRAALAAALALGAALAAYRVLPMALADPGAFFHLPDSARGPWWLAAQSGVRLPFFLGTATLVALAGTGAGPGSPLARVGPGGRGRRFTGPALAALAVCLALAAPPALFPFLGLVLAAAAGAGAARLRSAVPRAAPICLLLTAALALEAVPHQHGRLVTRSAAEVAAGPAWVPFLEALAGPERIAVLEGGDAAAPALALAGLARARLPESGVASTEALAAAGAAFVVSRKPRPREGLILVRSDPRDGAHVYLNPSRPGPAYWTERVEAAPPPESGRAPRLLIPRAEGGVVLAGAPPLPRAGGSWGRVRTLRREPNGVSCDLVLPVDAYLVFTDRLLAGMEARVDGAAAPLLPANGVQAALRLSAGRHEVRVSFRPPGLAAGGALSATAAALVPLLLAAPLLRALARRRPLAARGAPLPLPRPARSGQAGAALAP